MRVCMCVHVCACVGACSIDSGAGQSVRLYSSSGGGCAGCPGDGGASCPAGGDGDVVVVGGQRVR